MSQQQISVNSTAHTRGAAAFTRRDLVAVMAAVVVLALLLVPALQRSYQKSMRITCVNNLKTIGTAYRIWANDNGDQYPAFAPQTNGGWRDLLYLTNASIYAWTNYVTMANELAQSPLTLVCPSDERRPANTFSNHFANTNVSYFVGVNANDTYPQSLLGGDRNLGPGTTPDPEYGFSPADGRGNDVVINGPVCWSLKMHSCGNPAGAGNILLGDGSAQQVTSGNLYGNWVKNALAEKAAHREAANFTKATNSDTKFAGLRLIFP
jgi:competence protein ComGC